MGPQEDSGSEVRRFYRGRSILITGVSGFIGKVLLEKILRSFPGIGNIYLLIRDKKGLSASQRLEQLLQSRAFSFNPPSPEQVAKIIPVVGDASQEGFGISDHDLEIIRQSVSVIIHAAASIRFDSLLAEHIRTNVMGAKHLVSLCQSMHSLDALVFVSTAYSNCQEDEIDEKLYPLTQSPEEIISLYRMLDPESLESLVPKLIGNRPNTYVFTKALSEHIVSEVVAKTGITLAIARPAIVGPSVSEPTAGWTDSLHGPAGLSILAGLGIVQTVDWDFNVKPDAIPVDYLSNALLSSAWHSFTFRKSEASIYNMTSSNFRPMSAGEFMTYGKKASLALPSIYAMRPMMDPPRRRQSRFMYRIRCFFYHILFAYLIDALLGLAGRERIMVRIVRKMHHAMDLMQYFALRDWKFYSKNFMKLMVDLNEHDCVEFNCDIRTVKDEQQAIANVWLGVRRFILKEPDSNATLARQKYAAICVFYQMYQALLLYTLARLIVTYTPVPALLLWLLNTGLIFLGYNYGSHVAHNVGLSEITHLISDHHPFVNTTVL